MQTFGNSKDGKESLGAKATAAQSPTTVKSERDGYHESIWQSEPVSTNYPPEIFNPQKTYDVLIVGGGITGLTTALLLQKQGKECLIADAHTIGFGTTGGTTAHINTFADTTYAEVEKGFGEEAAVLFSKAIQGAIRTIEDLVYTYNIDCDFELKKGYVYAEDEKQAKELDELYESALKVGVAAQVVTKAPTPIPAVKVVEFDHQAQFHPLKYLAALHLEFIKLGGVVLEDTRIQEIRSEEHIHLAIAQNARIQAKNVVYATHIPPGGVNVLHFLCAPYRSYVLAVTLKNDLYPEALVYDMQDPYHYFRTHTIDEKKYLIVGGNDHKTGHSSPEQAFQELETYVRRHYDVDTMAYRWSSQYYVPADGLPYAGLLPGASPGIYVATGYNGNGMMLGTMSAKILSDLIAGNKNRLSDLFDPSRIKPLASAGEAVKENVDVIYHFILDRFTVHALTSVNELANDSGIVAETEGKKIAVYKDKEGTVSALNPICTHAGCIVSWNNEEKSWDCPCHGARFDTHGKVLTGPARKHLTPIDLAQPHITG
ncbi:FAD-dependent oxidoreductase [Runella slithyformis]|uniref:FAD dependent oxidoreductase n=1 Tax=Runella slithyformis (strain ATCC 29530 / DSM 19594 / LMG 11500 / NCIMB 11436 / LSU 4) TaxID=761193 RepID=A0A7U3ZKL0_RUNSL|nr:FAD-dependent oxidoreductase [Runella slithyformis]AEI48946.1 FAD dependent oxidoreductase [Runella slithyformis DSM 19594]